MQSQPNHLSAVQQHSGTSDTLVKIIHALPNAFTPFPLMAEIQNQHPSRQVDDSTQQVLKRELGVTDATFLGLGSIVGTGVFVSIGMGAGITGPSVVLAIGAASLLALCNALSSAQLAANHPVSGGTYEYGYRYLHPLLGFQAGWLFLIAKSASAATAALGFSSYLVHSLNWPPERIPTLAAGTTLMLTLLVAGGISRSNRVNTLMVSVTLLSLGYLVAICITSVDENSFQRLRPMWASVFKHPANFLHATGLMFVAFTGYGRIATLGEEVLQPRKTIPRAILLTLLVSALVYAVVALSALMIVGDRTLYQATLQNAAPLEDVARKMNHSALLVVITLGAMTAMLGVLLNLILGLSRVLLAMGRRGDMPAYTAGLATRSKSPVNSVLTMGLFVTALVFAGRIQFTWSLSAFTVLIYYGLTNLAALRLKREERLFPPFFSWCGFASCCFLVFWLDPTTKLFGLGVLGSGFAWFCLCSRLRTGTKSSESSISPDEPTVHRE
ncbi:MAG: APC family permease [Planctomycetota bacterium]|nr:APC family permease [Planctomycetota bacterium]